MQYLALYSGKTIDTAEIVAVTGDRRVIRQFADALISTEDEPAVDTVVDQPHRNGSGYRENGNCKRRVDI